MAVKIKLARMGKKGAPKYRIVVMEESKRPTGRYIEKIGFYDPLPNPHILTIDNDKLQSWIKNGAQMSDGVSKLMKNKIK
ncbi:MAG TPA: 30S ribosomal protein S16 [Candidatus Nitrosocosmicus sp.]|nr:30S ribosomal protein S16 [Candidatus Nitrosocosmicus sp.]